MKHFFTAVLSFVFTAAAAQPGLKYTEQHAEIKYTKVIMQYADTARKFFILQSFKIDTTEPELKEELHTGENNLGFPLAYYKEINDTTWYPASTIIYWAIGYRAEVQIPMRNMLNELQYNNLTDQLGSNANFLTWKLLYYTDADKNRLPASWIIFLDKEL